MTKYTFQTIVATSEVRANFTVLREELKSTDKELMTAMFELASKHREELEQLVEDQQANVRNLRERTKEIKAAAKVRMKELVKEMLMKEKEEVKSEQAEEELVAGE